MKELKFPIAAAVLCGFLAYLSPQSGGGTPGSITFEKGEYVAEEAAGNVTVFIKRTGDATTAATVDYATRDRTATAGLDYGELSGRLTFKPTEVSKSIMVSIFADPLKEDSETFELILSNATGATLGERTNAVLAIRDSNKLSQFVQESFSVEENGGAATILLKRSGDLTPAITLDYFTSDGSGVAGKDYMATKGTIIFAPGVSKQNITIPILDNGLVDGPRTVNITVSNSMVFPHPGTVVLTIHDNERQVLFDTNFVAPEELFKDDGVLVSSILSPGDGKVIVGGYFTTLANLPRRGIARLNADGSVDRSFDPGSGAGGGPYGASVSALALQPDGKIIVGGAFLSFNGRSHRSLARLNPDGTLDETFYASVNLESGSYPDVRGIIVQPDGKILFAGYYIRGIGLARLKADGSLDTTFHPPQRAVPDSSYLAIALQRDGRILAGGMSSDPSSGLPNLLRLEADGSLDTSFTFQPPVSRGENFSVSSLALQSDGKILASIDSLMLRLNPDGSLDTSFSDGSGTEVVALQILALPGGKILALGYPSSVRFNSDGSLDRLFELAYVSAAAILPDNGILAAGFLPGGLARIFPETDQRGGPEFTANNYSVSEMSDTVLLGVRRLGDSSQAMTVDFKTSDRTARNGFDYVGQQGTLHFAPLQVTNVISIAIVSDRELGKETFFEVTLTNSSNGSLLQYGRRATVTIASKEGGIQFASDTFTVDENQGFANVVVSRNGDALRSAAVDYFTRDGTATSAGDYMATFGTITFADGETSKVIRIPIFDNALVGGDKSIHIALTNAIAAVLGARTNATVMIHDNEKAGNGPPAISVGNATPFVTERAGFALVAIERSGETSSAASVHYATADGTALAGINYQALSGTLDFAPLENQKNIAIPILNDGIASDDTYFKLTISNPSEGFRIDSGSSNAVVTIVDAQRPGSIDSSFNPIIETTNVTSTGLQMALQPDAKIIVAGDFQHVNGVTRHGICRLNADGTLDSTFDPGDGLTSQPDNGPVAVYSIAVQTDGKVLVRGFFTRANRLNYTNFARFNADGSVDEKFQPDIATEVVNMSGQGTGMALLPTGKMLVAEGSDCCSSALARLEPDGAEDPTFVTVAVVGTTGGWGSTFRCIIVDNDGRPIFEGNTDSVMPFPQGPRKGLTRLNADATIDTSFNPVMDQLYGWDLGSRTHAVVEPDGKILTSGLFHQVNGVDRPGLARLNADGSTDGTFMPENTDENFDYVRALARQTDGKVLDSRGAGYIERLNVDGSPDRTFQFPLAQFQQKGFETTFPQILLEQDGQILVAIIATDVGSNSGIVRTSLKRLNGDKHLAKSQVNFRSVAYGTAGHVVLNLSVIPDRHYVIQSSADLIRWTSVATRTATNYLMVVTNSPLTVLRRFYRAVQTDP